MVFTLPALLKQPQQQFLLEKKIEEDFEAYFPTALDELTEHLSSDE
jgi:hypothetical protein